MASFPVPRHSDFLACSHDHSLLHKAVAKLVTNPREPPHLLVFGFDGHRLEPVVANESVAERALIGLSLASRFTALVVVAPASATRTPSAKHRPATIVLGLCRCGHPCSSLRIGDDVHAGRAPSGWLVDAAMLAVGRPCAPTARKPVEALLALWLDRLLVKLVDPSDPSPMSWTSTTHAAPIATSGTISAHQLAGTLVAAAPTWKHLRRACAIGDLAGLGVEPTWASVMDDSMFARFALGNFPELNDLRADVELLAPARIADQVHCCVTSALATS